MQPKCREQDTAATPGVKSPQKKKNEEVTTIQSVTGSFLIDLKHQNKTSTQVDSDGFFYSLFSVLVFWRGVCFFFLPKVSSSESLICKQTVKSLTAKSSNSREGKKSTFYRHQESRTCVLFNSQCVLPVRLSA